MLHVLYTSFPNSSPTIDTEEPFVQVKRIQSNGNRKKLLYEQHTSNRSLKLCNTSLLSRTLRMQMGVGVTARVVLNDAFSN